MGWQGVRIAMNFEQLMINGWQKEETGGSAEKISKIKHILKNWRVSFYTDRQALHQIETILRDSNIQETQPPIIERLLNLQKFTIKFDGGTPCNIPAKGYGIGYGSYQINDFPLVRCDFKIPMSANCAEITTLIYAIRNVLTLEPERHKVYLDIWGDSTIAVNWANGVTEAGRPCKISKKSSEEFRNAVQTLRDILKGFGKVQATWHSRTNSVKTFGH